MTINFWFPQVDAVLTELSLQFSVSRKNAEKVASVGEEILGLPDAIEAMQQSLEAAHRCVGMCERVLAQLKCSHIDYAVRQLKHWCEDDQRTWYDLNIRSHALRNAIRTELKDYHFYRYPKEKGQKLVSWKEEWKVALASFPEIAVDVFCATDCYALDHPVASVFHSMRVAEFGLRALAQERQVQLPKNKLVEWATWNEIIKALDAEAKKIGSSMAAGPAKDAALAFYSGALADLNGFKDEYRNLVMHVRANYDELQALRALRNVHAFMERLAAKIDHTRQRINWDLT